MDNHCVECFVFCVERKTGFENERKFKIFGTEIILEQKMSSNVRVFGVSPGVLVMGCDFAWCFGKDIHQLVRT